MAEKMFDFFSSLNADCLFVALVLILGFAWGVWRAFQKETIVLGTLYRDKSERYVLYRDGYLRLLEAGHGTQTLASAAISKLEAD